MKTNKLFLILWVCLSLLIFASKIVYSYGAWCPEPLYTGGPECFGCHGGIPVNCHYYNEFCVRGEGEDCINCHIVEINKYCIMAPTVTVTTTAGPNGSVSPSGSFEVETYSDVTLTFTPNVGYQVEDILISSTWNGNSVGPVWFYTIPNVTSNHLIEATFAVSTCLGDPVQMDTTYLSIQSAYDDIVNGSSETISMQSKNFGEDLILDWDVDVILKGGYDCDFNEPPVSFSAIRSLTISGGTVGVEHIILKE